MNIEGLFQRTGVMRQHLLNLYQTTIALPWISSDLLPQAFKELHTTLKMLLAAIDELHQQNEEFVQTRNLAEVERQHYQELFEYLPVGYLRTNLQGIIEDANQEVGRLLNINQKFLVGKPLISFVVQECQQYFCRELLELSKSDQVTQLFVVFKPRYISSFNASLMVRSCLNLHSNQSNLYWLIQKSSTSITVDMPAIDVHQQILQDRQIHKYSKGDNIPLDNTFFAYVVQGLVKLSTLSQTGTEILIGLATSGMVFGSTMTNLPLYESTAISDVELVLIYVSEMRAIPNLNQMLLPKIKQRLQQAESFLFIISHYNVEDRLSSLLEMLKLELGEPVVEGTRLLFRLTHEDIASACNSTRVTITRLLNKLQKQGRIKYDDRKHIIICN
ncbi:transcriptional regulator [Cylindrospermopsis raciborskii CENA303]|uniref:Transcriptional regulator n=1 Tax=Cylindrospermopsis raciborskii CENA303 TaxID=1170769 RepID=A0A1X4G4Y8_9CYAN|nr:helix-turn-helix domain-containing protein [Cylindrospermopsis raciborskii]EFA72000.1 Possible Transcriptional Regulator, Crp/Fnr family [Raphidiopsis brookii D9]OSO89520.1 transcriptional regulator [Cylindrospermopsis raciborskii CENA303]